MKDFLILKKGEETNGLLKLIIPESKQIDLKTVAVTTLRLDPRNPQKVAYRQIKDFAERIGANFAVLDVSEPLVNNHSYCATVSFYLNTH